MSESITKIRPIVIIQGTPVACEIVPHKTDDSKVVLKSPTPEGGASLAQMAGVPVEGEMVKGRYFFIVTVDKAKLLEGLSRAVGKALDQAEPTKDAPKIIGYGEDGEPLYEGTDEEAALVAALEGKLN